MDNIFNLINLIAAITSIILALISIKLSLYFYDKSKEESKESYELSKKIESNVDKLEDMFDKLYSDTFSIVKDSFEKMSTYVYQDKESTEIQKVNKEIEEKKDEILEAVTGKLNNKDIEKTELKNMFNEFLKNTKEAEKSVIRKYIRESIINILKTKNGASFRELEQFFAKEDINQKNIHLFSELEEMVDENLINDPFRQEYIHEEGKDVKVISADTKITLI